MHPFLFACANVLGGIVAQAVGDGGNGSDGHVVQLDGCRIAAHSRRAEGIDHALDDDVADGDEALLEGTRNGNMEDFPQDGEREQAAIPLMLQGMHLLQDSNQSGDTAQALAQESCPGNACNTHVEFLYEKDIHKDVGNGADRQEPEGRLRIAQSGEDARCHIIDQQEHIAQQINIQVQFGIGEDFFRRVDEPQQPRRNANAHQRQHKTHDGRENQCRVHAGANVAVPLLSVEIGSNDGSADVAAHGHGNVDQGNLVGIAHSSQCSCADIPAGHKAICHVVQLLEDDGAKERQDVTEQYLARMSCGKILHV